LTVLIKNGEEWNESLPITRTQPYQFEKDRENAVDSLKIRMKLGVYATVENCMNALYETYDISDKYEEPMRRYIAGVRYEMSLKDFSTENKFELASGISSDTVLELKELSSLMSGMEISEGWNRLYLDGTTAPHIRGTVGAISAEKYAELKSSGYNMNDIIGTSGIELALESTLRGERGVREITRNSDGMKVSDEIIQEPQSGNSVMLTIDSKFQNMVEQIVQYHMDFLHSPYYTTAMDATLRGNQTEVGSAVVLNVKDGSVLAMVTLPSYDINDLVENYGAVLNAKNSPLLNRAINGEYRPGSTFKTITATAGLAEGVITPSTTITCNQVYTYYAPSFTPKCTGYHGAITVQYGLKHSCNIFFYETARRMGIDRLAYWASRFGIGQDLGFEIPMSTGRMTSPEIFDKLGLEWNASDTIQAGIGQSETLLTPLHLATQAMTIANNGVRYRPHVVKAIYNYDFTELIEEIQPEIMDEMTGMDDIFAEVKAGMKRVSENANFLLDGGWYNIYDYKGIGKENVCTKTGTPEVIAMTRFNSTIVGFYPADDPEIAFGVCMENSEYSRHIACNIISAYVTGEFNPVYDEDGNAMYPLGESNKAKEQNEANTSS
ncbi:MAG: peptidoglycan D,D-transpeptidase FtsI family protein, partial [Oscillospiraceae bacterium]